MASWIVTTDSGLATSTILALVLSLTTVYYYVKIKRMRLQASPDKAQVKKQIEDTSNLSALQQHVLFWDRDNDHIIYPHDIYNGFREIGFSIPFALTALWIPVFFSYSTRLGHSLIPDPLFRIYLNDIHKAKHGSDTGIYDTKGNLRMNMYEEIFSEFDSTQVGGLGARDLWNLIANDRVAADPAGWIFAVMEWSTTWLLLQRDGQVWKEDLRQCYDGTLFWRLSEERMNGVENGRGYGWKEFWRDPGYILRELRVDE